MRIAILNRLNSVLRVCGGWVVCLAGALTLTFIGGGTAYSRTVQAGVIKGKVVAETPGQRKPLAGVVVRLSGAPPANKKIEAVSDEEGGYILTGLVAGDYVISVELQGFQRYEKRVGVQIEATVELNILLQP